MDNAEAWKDEATRFVRRQQDAKICCERRVARLEETAEHSRALIEIHGDNCIRDIPCERLVKRAVDSHPRVDRPAPFRRCKGDVRRTTSWTRGHRREE